MGFLYPLFLLAAAVLAIPVIIHLFNLRRYKTVLFPHTRFLKNVQLHSRRQSQVRYKWLLALRLLLLAALILAFAQPFFRDKTDKQTGKGLQVIYIDNSASMSLKKGSRSLLDIARATAIKQVQSAPAGSRFLLLTNDKPVSYEPVAADKALSILHEIDISPESKANTKQLAFIQSMLQNSSSDHADLYYYSDFQKNTFTSRPDPALLKGVDLHAIAVQAPAVTNVAIDTAYLTTPAIQSNIPAQLIVRTSLNGKAPAEMPVLQLQVNGQVKSAVSPVFNGQRISTDTLGFTVNDAGWQRLTLSVNDASLRFDDTFRIAVRSAPALSVLVLNEQGPNPYIQAAFSANNGFRLVQDNVNTAPENWKEYNLVILNDITRLNDAVGVQLRNALQSGQSVCIFPGRTRDLAALNKALSYAGDIRISGYDSVVQPAATLQQGSDLVKDLFEQIPENVQLPVANGHYRIQGGLTANQQSVLGFRNGDPFLAKYTAGKGNVYLCATNADAGSSNFPSSYFFVPFLYQMAMQSAAGNVYALTAGAQQPAFIPVSAAGDRNMVHLYGPGLDAIPPQKTIAGGVNVWVDAAVQQPGFYKLAAASGDSAVVGLNADRTESRTETWDMNALKKEWTGKQATWQTADQFSGTATGNTGSFPLWKVCIILALLVLAAETWLLCSQRLSQTIPTS